MLEIDIEEYNLFLLQGYGENKIFRAILLHNEEDANAFQDTIDEAKEKYEDEISKNGNDWEYISRDLAKFDYIDLDVYDTLYY